MIEKRNGGKENSPLENGWMAKFSVDLVLVVRFVANGMILCKCLPTFEPHNCSCCDGVVPSTVGAFANWLLWKLVRGSFGHCCSLLFSFCLANGNEHFDAGTVASTQEVLMTGRSLIPLSFPAATSQSTLLAQPSRTCTSEPPSDVTVLPLPSNVLLELLLDPNWSDCIRPVVDFIAVSTDDDDASGGSCCANAWNLFFVPVDWTSTWFRL